MPDFYALDGLEQLAVNLFYGWGYNFYRLENQLRADDLTLRAQVGGLLGQARSSVESAESAFRAAFLPPPSREKPRPDPSAIAAAQALEKLSAAIGSLEGQIRAQPAPENDRMTQRYRNEAATLQKLFQCDMKLAARAELLRTLLNGKDGGWMVENAPAVREGLKAIEAALREREDVLVV